MTAPQPILKDDPQINPNALHDFHFTKRGPRNVPEHVYAISDSTKETLPKDTGHSYADTSHIQFKFFDQRKSNAPFGYEYFVSLPPDYDLDSEKRWPLILFLHGSGESQRGSNESYATLRHGIPKIILCYDRLKSGKPASIDIPRAPRLRKPGETGGGDLSSEPVDADVCNILAENFVTVSPSLNMEFGYGWTAPVLSALLDEIVERYRIDLDQIHISGFSMGGYGTWSLAVHSPNRFASVMPICGGGDPAHAIWISHLPHWIHHGDKDDIIPLKASQQMCEALERAGSTHVTFTRYPDLMHDSWTAAYNNIEIYKWMLNHKRRLKGDENVVLDANKVIVT